MTSSRAPSAIISVLTGAVGAVLGLLPWLMTGLRLPLQYVWNTQAMPDDMPLTLLPLSQYYLVESAAMMVVGSALAGIVYRVMAARDLHLRLWLVGCSAVLVQGAALIQSAITLADGLEDSSRAQVYAYGLVAGVIVGIAAGFAVLMGLARGRVPAITLAVTFAALALAQWIPPLVMHMGTDWLDTVPRGLAQTVLGLATLLPLLLVGAAVGWCGLASVRRTVAAVVSFLSLWVVPALITAFTYALSTGMYLRHPADLWPAGSHVFRQALISAGAPERMFVAAVVALLVAITLRSMRRGLPR